MTKLPDDLKDLKTFELRAGVTADEVSAVIRETLNTLDRTRYTVVHETQERRIEYQGSKDGKLMGVYAIGWDASGKVGHKPVWNSDDPNLAREWDRIAWDMIWVSVLRQFGQRGDNGAQPVKPSAGEAHSLQRQLADARENLRVIEEHKAQYVREVDIPLQDIKDERRLKEQITEIEKKLGASGPSEKYT